MNSLQQPHETRLRGLPAAEPPGGRSTPPGFMFPPRHLKPRASVKRRVQSAKADFVPFQRRVSNPS